MPFDAIFLSAVCDELRQELIGARVEKIQQPARDMVVLQLRGKARLLLSASGNRPRFHVTQASYENPAQPPMFCMLLRKHLAGGRIAAIEQPPAERSVELTLDCTDEMGTPCQKRLILELMGRNSNLILTDGENRILDCMRRVDFEMSEQRQVLPGLFYHRPPRQEGKLTPQELTKPALERLLAQTAAPVHLDRWIVDHVAGISPLIARELAFGFCGETDADVLTLDRARLAEALTQPSLLQARQPTLLLCGGRPKDFTYCPIRQYSAYMTARTMPSFSALLDAFYTETEQRERMLQKSQSLRRTVTNLLERTRRKLAAQRKEREASLDRETLRRRGDIVTANLHAMTRGMTVLRAEDFYQEDMPEIEIPLRPELSPQQNAARFYKEYNKAKHAEKILAEQIARGEIEEEYLGAVLDELNRAESERDLAEIRAELEAGGYVRSADRRRQQKQPASRPMRFRSSDGFEILVGRNNRQNDQLSLKTARRDDLWLHIQKFHGTHVIICCAGAPVPDGTITEAAMLAAWYSQAREGQNVPVDVTQVRNLRKPNGAKPGMVVYDRYRTVIVTPDAALCERLRAE
ncbi:MAG: NFACT RNA binding domain-containing protein [Candidatus Faecousia sp.]|uniref:Rqc2 family fibronectin-binding protein n=1 Tax=Faecousia sp. TaxID=2952921 RepID=UPI002A88890D|nr:NFACT RNA binding domain-containing protein [Candidatus Faecousia sp.]